MISFVTWMLVIRAIYLIWITLRMQINEACTVDRKVQKENGDNIAPESFMLYNNLWGHHHNDICREKNKDIRYSQLMSHFERKFYIITVIFCLFILLGISCVVFIKKGVQSLPLLFTFELLTRVLNEVIFDYKLLQKRLRFYSQNNLNYNTPAGKENYVNQDLNRTEQPEVKSEAAATSEAHACESL